MHALPANIQPRAYFPGQNPAPYRAYDDDGDVYFISGRHGAWAASCAADPAKPNLYAATLQRLSMKLARTHYPRPRQLQLNI